MKIQAITRENGAGLSKDIQVLREALPYEIDFTPYNTPRRSGVWHWNFHLELVNPQQLRTGHVNALVPNPEWFEPAWIPYIRQFDVVLAKTRDTERIFQQHHGNVVYTGWSTPDPGCTVDYTGTNVCHIAGKSIMKGTAQVLEAARRAPELTVHVVIDKAPKHAPPNVVIHTNPTEAELCEIRRAPIHLQPSTYEGFGHVVNESRAMGAVIITTAAEPMNELVGASHALLCPASTTRHKMLATEHIPDIDVLAECMRIAAAQVRANGPGWGKLARQGYEADRAAFHERINALVK